MRLLERDRKFLHSISEILSKRKGAGSLSTKIEIEGITHTYSFSLPTGLGSQFYRRKYVQHFKSEVPAWVMQVHPASIISLCKLALKEDVELPQDPGRAYLGNITSKRKAAG